MYQILFFLPPPPVPQHFITESTLRAHFCSGEELQSNIVLLFEDGNRDDYNPAYPAIAFYLRGTANIPQKLEARLKELQEEDVMFVPCCNRLTDVAECVPLILRGYQAMDIADDIEGFLTKAKNTALSYFHLLGTPKIFISYSQREKSTTRFALELFEGLSRKRYAPFLDTRCIQAPSIFQQVLEEELWDADIVILLDSEQAQQSKWCQKEAALAMEASMGVIRVEWPKVKQIHNFPLIENVKLSTWDLYLKRERKKKLSAILQKVDEMRARAHAARHKKLLDKISLTNTPKLIPQNKGKCYYYATAESEHAQRIVPIIGIPRSQDFHRAQAAFLEDPFELAYIPISELSDTARHIHWLSQQLKIEIKAY